MAGDEREVGRREDLVVCPPRQAVEKDHQAEAASETDEVAHHQLRLCTGAHIAHVARRSHRHEENAATVSGSHIGTLLQHRSHGGERQKRSRYPDGGGELV